MKIKDESVEKTHFVFWFSWKLLCFKGWSFPKPFECNKKSNFVKEDKTIVRSTHPPLETFLVKCKRTEVKASPFKIADEQTPIHSIIEQNNFTNESLHVIGQQLNRIKEKIVETTAASKPKKPLIDLPNQKEKVKFKTSQAKTLELLRKCFLI